MTKTEFNFLFREYAKNYLTPTEDERNLVSKLYNAFDIALEQNCLLVGSYARFTAIRPPHDLDILFIGGDFDPNHIDPKSLLDKLNSRLQRNFVNPTNLQTKTALQSHSVTVSFLDGEEEIFAVDIVPALVSGDKNEYGDDLYFVPEILKTGRSKRAALYAEFEKTKSDERSWWIKSDPRGYIKLAGEINQNNGDFRKAAKIIKKWKRNCKELDDGFKLKSFHVEQVVMSYFQGSLDMEIFDAIYKFFCDIPRIISNAQIPDRADSSVMIDKYVEEMTDMEKTKIIQARDYFLIKLENFRVNSTINDLLNAGYYNRHSKAEAYLFDSQIPVFTDPAISFVIDGKVRPLNGFSDGWLRDSLPLQKGLTSGAGRTRYIDFSLIGQGIGADVYKWKVKNDNNCSQPRGEITDNHTLRTPESTMYPGHHYVECFAIKDGICVAKAKRDVNII